MQGGGLTSRLAVRWLIVKLLIGSCLVLQCHRQKRYIITISGLWHIIFANIGIIQTSQLLFFWFKNIQGFSKMTAHSSYSALLHLCHPNILRIYFRKSKYREIKKVVQSHSSSNEWNLIHFFSNTTATVLYPTLSFHPEWFTELHFI